MMITDPTYTDARKALETYPYFAYAALKAIPLAPDKKERDELRRIVAVNIGDSSDLREILGLNSESLADFYPDTLPPHLDTFDTIDSFLTRYGEQSPRVVPDNNYAASIESVPAPGLSDTAGDIRTPDAAGSPEPATPDSTSSAIDAFLKAVPPPQPKRPKKIPVQEESPALTESFAKILIKNQNYTKALQIIEDLNLKNPEKSVYFADQIRFLKKLIINQSKQSN